MREENGLCERLNIIITEFKLEADLRIPLGARAIILFAHGSGSSRDSIRNHYIARALSDAGFATLLVDLLTFQEKGVDSRTRHIRYNIDLLASRFESVTRWLIESPDTRSLAIGYFGSSTGASAALISASKFGNLVRAIVSRGGRTDLAEAQLGKVVSPTLLVAGDSDAAVIGINKRALKELKHAQAKQLIVIPGTGHIFEEPGKIEEVAAAAVKWFECHLVQTEKQFVHKRNANFADSLSSIFRTRKNLQLKFRDREAAGEMLAATLSRYTSDPPVIIGIARGGVVVADTIARELTADFDIIVPSRLRAPSNSEIAIGAIMQDSSVYLDTSILHSLKVSDEYLEAEILEQKQEIDRRLALYRPMQREYNVKGRTIILVDDGISTGATMIVAARWTKKLQPRLLVISAPIASPKAIPRLRNEADHLAIIRSPSNFRTVEDYFQDYGPVEDEDVIQIARNR